MKAVLILLLSFLFAGSAWANMIGGDFYIVSDYAAERPWPSSGSEVSQSVEQVTAPQPMQCEAILMPGLVVDLLSCSPQGGTLLHLSPTTYTVVLLCAPTPQSVDNIANITTPTATPTKCDEPNPVEENVELIGLTTEGGKGASQSIDANQQETIVSSTAELDTDLAVALFQRERPLPNGASPLAEFAKLMAIPPAIGVPNVSYERGNSQSIAQALRALSNHVKTHESEVPAEERPLIEERFTQILSFLDGLSRHSSSLDERRVTSVCVALSQIGQVEAHRGVSEAGDRRPHRYGWRRLREYFRVAFDGKMNTALENSIKYKNAQYPPHWCGIFCWWALKVSGYELPPWPTGVGIYGSVPQRPRKSDSIAGDIAFHGGRNGHMALVVSINGDQMQTIDGNTLNPTKGTGGQVWFKGNKGLSAMHSMYSPTRDSTFP